MIKCGLFAAGLSTASLGKAGFMRRKSAQVVSAWEPLVDDDGELVTDANGEIVYVLN